MRRAELVRVSTGGHLREDGDLLPLEVLVRVILRPGGSGRKLQRMPRRTVQLGDPMLCDPLLQRRRNRASTEELQERSAALGAQHPDELREAEEDHKTKETKDENVDLDDDSGRNSLLHLMVSPSRSSPRS